MSLLDLSAAPECREFGDRSGALGLDGVETRPFVDRVAVEGFARGFEASFCRLVGRVRALRLLLGSCAGLERVAEAIGAVGVDRLLIGEHSPEAIGLGLRLHQRRLDALELGRDVGARGLLGPGALLGDEIGSRRREVLELTPELGLVARGGAPRSRRGFEMFALLERDGPRFLGSTRVGGGDLLQLGGPPPLPAGSGGVEQDEIVGEDRCRRELGEPVVDDDRVGHSRVGGRLVGPSPVQRTVPQVDHRIGLLVLAKAWHPTSSVGICRSRT